MNVYLKADEYMPHAPDVVGQKVRVNHDSADCSGDSRSMTVERRDDGVYARCFRCGKFGSNREAKPRHFFAKVKDEGVGDSGSSTITLPYDTTGVIGDWPSKARVWVTKARLSDEEVKRYGISYSNGLGRIILPVYNDGSLVGYQARKIFESDEGPKYYTRTNHPDRMVFFVEHPHNNDTVVLCEDVLSAIRCSRFMSAGAILGTSTSDYALDVLTKGKKYAIIYLDYDNRIVINNSIKLKNKLELLLDNVKLITNQIDPKNLSDEELRRVLL